MPPKGEQPRTHLVLRLRKGWSYDSANRRFTRSGGEAFSPKADLPKYSRVRHQIPSIAKKAKRTDVEDDLARGILIVLPRGEGDAGLAGLAARVREWPCVEKVWISPEVTPANGT